MREGIKNLGTLKVILLLVTLLFSMASFARSSKKVKLYNFENVKFKKNYDGDTATFDIDSVHPMLGKNAKIRVRGIDTPEIRGSDKCEKDLARAAKRLVKSELKNAKKVTLSNCGKGKYFRLVCDINYDGKNLKTILFKNKLAYSYEGGKKRKINWCNRK